jgi:O-antigen ligase
MDNTTRHAISTSIIIGIITLPIMGLVFLTNRDIGLLFGVLALALLAMLLFSRPYLGLPALLVVRPAIDILGDRTIALGSFTINVAAIMSFLAIVWALWILVPHWRRVIDLPLFWPAAVLFGVSAWSFLGTINQAATITELVRLGGCFLLLFVALWQTRRVEDVLRVYSGLALGLCLPVLLAFVQVFTNTGLTFADSVNRAYGTFGHPNVLAFYLVLAIFAILGMRAARQEERYTHPAMIILLGITLLLTQTRGAWLGLLIGLLYVGIMRYRQALLIGGISLVAVLLLLPVADQALQSVGFDMNRAPILGPIVTRQFDTSSLDWRLDVWKEMDERFFERPLQGFGLGSFPTLRQLQVFDIYDQGIGAHNDYLRLLIELGCLGVLVYGYFLVETARNLLSTKRLHVASQLHHLPLFLFAFFLAFLVMSYFDNLLQSTPVMWAWFILLGTTLATRPEKNT